MNQRVRLAGAALSGALLVSASAAIPASAALGSGQGTGSTTSDTPSSSPGVDRTSAVVQLSLDPLTTAEKTRPAPGKKVDFDSSAVRSQRARLQAQRNDFKKWLHANAKGARVVGEHDLAVNAVVVELNGTSIDALRSGPGVTSVGYQGRYRPTAEETAYLDLSLVDGIPGSDTPADAGEGTKVAIIDTGIDIRNPCFSDDGTSVSTGLDEMTSWTNDKVVVAKVFHNKARQQGLTAAPVQDHGTHVAGTVACAFGTEATVNGVDLPDQLSGVAPAAELGNYNVFPGDVLDARSEDILDALEAAYEDGMDVANLSLGGDANGAQDLLTHAIDNLDAAGMVVAVAAGNSGPGFGTVESPGSAERALTAGASTVGHFVGAPVTVEGGPRVLAAAGDFETVDADFSGTLRVATGGTNGLDPACSALPGAYPGADDIVLITRGACSFSQKIRNAEAAGAEVVLVANNVAGDPIAMAEDGTADQPTVPAYMVGLDEGQELTANDGATTTVGADNQYAQTGNDDIMAGFSSQGPTDVTYRVKPDVVAPGVNVLSSIPNEFCDEAPCFAFFQGTSMATPHLAGTAAVLVAEHPDWSAAQVRSAIVNTATPGLLTDYQTGEDVVTDPTVVGAGLQDVAASLGASVALDPVSVSFGAVPSGSGQTRTATVTLSDLTGSGGTYGLSVGDESDSAVSFTVSDGTVSIPAGGSATVSVTMTFDKKADAGSHWATLQVGDVGHAVLYTYLR